VYKYWVATDEENEYVQCVHGCLLLYSWTMSLFALCCLNPVSTRALSLLEGKQRARCIFVYTFRLLHVMMYGLFQMTAMLGQLLVDLRCMFATKWLLLGCATISCLLVTLWLFRPIRARKRTLNVNDRIAQLADDIAAHSAYEETMQHDVRRNLAEANVATAPRLCDSLVANAERRTRRHA
jgi:hypothetical protein